MKRFVSLLLCMSMLLGLFVGLAGAAETPQNTSELVLESDMTMLTGYFGSRGFALRLKDPNNENDAGILVPNNDPDYNVYFSNPLLGTLEKTDSDKEWAADFPWTWSSENAVPGENGSIVVEHGGKKYTVSVSTGHPEIGFYTDSSCSLESLITEENRDFAFAKGGTVDVYVKINENSWSFDKEDSVSASIITWVSDGENETEVEDTACCTTKILDEKTAKVTVADFGKREANLKIVVDLENEDERWNLYMWLHRDDSDVFKIVTMEDGQRKELDILKWRQFTGSAFCNLEINGQRIGNGENVEVWFDNSGLGNVRSTANSSLSEANKAAYDWIYSFSGMMPGENGYLVVRVGDREYRKFVSTGYPDVGVYTSFDCNPDSYLALKRNPCVEYFPGAPVTLYAYSRYYSIPKYVSGTPNLISIKQLDLGHWYSLTFAAPDTGDYPYEVEFGDTLLNVEFVKGDTLWAMFQGHPDEMEERPEQRFLLTNLEIGDWDKFDLFYRLGDGKLRKVIPGDDVSVQLAGDNLGTVYETPNDWNPTNGYWVWDRSTAVPGQSGQIVATVNGTAYSCPVSTQATEIGLYTDPAGTWQSLLQPEPNMHFVEVDYPANGILNLYVRVDPDVMAKYEKMEIDVGSGVEIAYDSGGAMLTWKETEEGYGGMWSVGVVLLNEENGSRKEYWISISPLKVLEEVVKITENNDAALHTLPDCILTEERDQEYFDTTRNMHNFPKVYTDGKGKDYYLGLAVLNGPETWIVNCISFPYDGTMTLPYAALFYTEDSDQMVPVRPEQLDTTTRNALEALYDTLEMKIYPTRVREDYIVRTEMPRVTGGSDEWLAGQNYTFNENSGGGYLVTVHGIMDDGAAKNHAICAYSFLEMVPTLNNTVRVKDLVDENQPVTVEVINDYLNNHPNMGEKDRLTLDFTGIYGEEMALRGTIVIPNHLWNVKLAGDWEHGTVLYGGVESHGTAGSTVSSFKFFSTASGKNAEKLVDGKTPNYAIYGRTGAVHEYCEFEGYYHAVHIGPDAVHISFGAHNSTFRNNHIGIYVDYRATSGGTVDARSLVFWRNDIGIYLAKNQNFRASFLNLYTAKFINNTVDIQNDTGTIWWTPMNFFWHHPSDDKYESHASNKKNASQWQPVVEGAVTVEVAKGINKTMDSVIAYPVSVSPDFQKGYFYSNRADISSVLMSRYPPSVSSMPLNEETGVYAFSFVVENQAEAPQSSLFSMAMLDENDGGEQSEDSRMKSRTEIMADLVLTRTSQSRSGTEEPTDDVDFAVSLDRTFHPGAVVLVLGELPAGFSGQLTVPLGSAEDPWFDAKVYCNGTLLDAAVENGEITFRTVEANTSGSAQYEIMRVENSIGGLLDLKDQLLTEIPDGAFSVQVQTNAGASAEAVLAAYDANGKMLEIHPVVVKNGYDYATVKIENKNGNVAELRVFLLTELRSGQPLCGNLIFPNP